MLALRTRDQADIVDAVCSFHLNAGVDLVIATDHRSRDGTRDILDAYAREGVARLLCEDGEEVKGREWRTRMARMAAVEYGADWVIHCDGDEFWWPRGRSLKEVLEAIPGRYGAVLGLVRTFCPRPDDGSFFAERMTVRASPPAPLLDPGSDLQPGTKIAHRAFANAEVDRGAHVLLAPPVVPLRAWLPLEILHFPTRDRDQYERRSLAWYAALPERKRGRYARAVQAAAAGRLEERYASLVVDEEVLARGLAQGSLTVDTRLRDVLRELRLPQPAGERRFALPRELSRPISLPFPDLVDEAAYAAEVAALREAELARLARQVDGLELRLAKLEASPWARALRLLQRLAGRRRGGAR